ncbi:MAG: c-type cytochrome [Nitrospiraceae bacterium]
MTCGVALVMTALFAASGSGADDRGPGLMRPRVPADQLEAARALTNPLPDSPYVIAQGKLMYEGKGTCVTCHGTNGRGDGPAAAGLQPSPRNFHHRGLWRHRSEGELFWVVKHGSPGTGMPAFGASLSDEDIWSILRYERTFAPQGGPMHGPGAGHGRHAR